MEKVEDAVHGSALCDDFVLNRPVEVPETTVEIDEGSGQNRRIQAIAYLQRTRSMAMEELSASFDQVRC